MSKTLHCTGSIVLLVTGCFVDVATNLDHSRAADVLISFRGSHLVIYHIFQRHQSSAFILALAGVAQMA